MVNRICSGLFGKHVVWTVLKFVLNVEAACLQNLSERKSKRFPSVVRYVVYYTLVGLFSLLGFDSIKSSSLVWRYTCSLVFLESHPRRLLS